MKDSIVYPICIINPTTLSEVSSLMNHTTNLLPYMCFRIAGTNVLENMNVFDSQMELMMKELVPWSKWPTLPLTMTVIWCFDGRTTESFKTPSLHSRSTKCTCGIEWTPHRLGNPCYPCIQGGCILFPEVIECYHVSH